jgi:hypothetical protein
VLPADDAVEGIHGAVLERVTPLLPERALVGTP